MKAVCRVGDQITGTCTGPGHSSRTFTGTWLTGSSFVTIEGIAVVRVGDNGITDCNHPIIAQGSSSLVADDMALHCVGDAVTLPLGGNGVSVTGSDLLFVD